MPFTDCRYRAFSLLVLLLLGATSHLSFAADKSTPWTVPHFSIAAKDLHEDASTPASPEGADASVLNDEESYVFDASGRSVYTEYLVYKVLTQKGAEAWDDISVNWEPWHQERPTIKARVITPDYAVHELDLKTITDAPVQDDDADVYSDRRVIRAPLPAISSGSVVEQEITLRDNAPFFAAGTVNRVFFGRVSTPVQHSGLILQAPSSIPLRYELQLLPDLTPKRAEEGGNIRLVFEHGPMEPLEQADANLPSDVLAYPAIVFSTGNSWQQVADQYAKTVDQRLSTTDLHPLVEKLIHGKTSRNEKLQALLDYLDQQIRYTGVEFGESSIVPHSPADTLAQRYGDCKDKSTLLVGMLRAAGIPAYLALLNAGGRLDVPTDLPGMGLFDHAIVYVPGDLWIDATDEYGRVGQLPMADQGRLALIARGDTTGLVRTTESSSKDNVLFELREIQMAENGPASVVETSRPRGVFESEFRSYYSDKQNKKTRENLTDYVKSQYLAEKLDRLDRSDPDNLNQQFELVLESRKARRGYTEIDNAVAAIRVEGLFYRLPDELQKRAGDETKQETGKEKKKRTADYQLAQPFVSEWQYRIHPPLGFQPKSLPGDAKQSVGPALLTEHFEAEKDGMVRADIRFDTMKRRFTVAEATELRNRVADLKESEAILINFEPTARVLQSQGKWRESLQTYRSLISQHPTEALHHLQIAKSLLDAGMGEAARREAQMAVKLEPKSALAEKTLAEILEYDVVGRKFRPGSDYSGSAAAFREAAKLDPDDKAVLGDLAILLEHNEDGVRYGAGANLKDAIATYRKLGAEKLSSIGLSNNLAFALFYAGQFDEALQNAETLNPQPKALIIACEAAKNGTPAALAEANKRSDSDDSRKQNLKAAGEMLMNVRKYSVASDLLQAGASGENAAATVGLASMLRKAQLHEQIQFANTPSDLVRKFVLVSLEPGLTSEKLIALSSKNAVMAIKNTEAEELQKALNSGRTFRRSLARKGSLVDVTLDTFMIMAELKQEGDDQTGYRERLQMPGAKLTFFVVKEDASYRILDTSEKPNSVALEILDRIAAKNLAGAATLLNWMREEQHIEGGDDPLAGAAFPRLWSKRPEGEAEQMRIAAASILVQTKPMAKEGVAILEEAKKAASEAADKTNINLALLTGYATLGDFSRELAVAVELSKQYPDSRRIFFAQSFALRALGRTEEADKLAQDRLKATPDDIDALRALVANAVARQDYRAAYERGKAIVDAGRAEGNEFNSMAWQTLFFDRAEGPDIEAAVKASQLSSNNSAYLHTLGCVYAELGKTKEAREVLLQGMDLQNLDEPDSAYWYALGRIAEQYGETETASADYARVTKPRHNLDLPDSTYQLAQNRLKFMATGVQRASIGQRK